MKISFFISFLLLFSICHAQQDITFYGDVMVNAYEGKNRKFAGEEFIKLLKSELTKENSFDKDLSYLKFISIKSDKNKTFRIITWQVKDEKEVSKSYGFIQMKNGKLYELKDNINGYIKENEYETMSADNWYGAAYYSMKEFESKNGKAYLLFGYDAYDANNRQKVIDVLTFENDKPVFGAEVFKISEGARPDLKSRIIIDYSSIANVNCNYNEGMDMIIYDFVVARAGVGLNGSIAKIPDGTYSAFTFKDGYWNFVDKLANQISSPSDIFYQPKSPDKRDQFGRIKN